MAKKTFKELKIGDPIYLLYITMQPQETYIASITPSRDSYYLIFTLKDNCGNKLPYTRTIHRKFLDKTASISTATNKEDAYKLKVKSIARYNQKYRRNEAPFIFPI